MWLEFTWSEGNPIRPRCECNCVNSDGISLLSCLLMDDGGCGYIQSMDGIDEGLRRIAFVQSGAATSSDWCRETWGARLTINDAVIFSLHDVFYSQTITLSQLKAALLAWREFLVSAPLPNLVRSVEI